MSRGLGDVYKRQDIHNNDLTIALDTYEWDGLDISTQPIDWDDGSQTVRTETIAQGSDVVVSDIWEAMISEGQRINNEGYDYEYLTQNCDTAMAHMVKAGEVRYNELKLQADSNQQSLALESWKGLDLPDDNGNEYWTPGVDLELNHSVVDKIVDFIKGKERNISCIPM